jgi:hypothetical protein
MEVRVPKSAKTLVYANIDVLKEDLKDPKKRNPTTLFRLAEAQF